MQEIDKELLISIIHLLSAGSPDQYADKLPIVDVIIVVREDWLPDFVGHNILKIAIILVDIGCIEVYHV